MGEASTTGNAVHFSCDFALFRTASTNAIVRRPDSSPGYQSESPGAPPVAPPPSRNASATAQ